MSSPRNTSSVQVVVRLRPMNENEKKHGTLPVVTASTQDKTVTVIKGQGSRQIRSSFSFDNVFTAFSSQQEVFEATLKSVIGDVMHGYESTVFAYGQTGTGKTHTMEGELSSAENHGVIPRSAQAIFETLKKPEYSSPIITCSYLEIYNEELCDLLSDELQRVTEKKQTKLEIMEGKEGTFCRGLTEKQVRSASDVLQLMQKAQNQRKIGETKMNKQSSRSHCIFTISINAKKKVIDGGCLEFNGKLHMVDLAGSECAKTASLDKSSGCEAARERERMNINRSLLTLGRVISMLKDQSTTKRSQNVRIPYRDSKLTRILQESLGGRCKTVVIATLSPSVTAVEESISTLNYAQSANGIVNKPVATSFLSVNPITSKTFQAQQKVIGGMDQGNSVEHWHEMECKLTYMQAQVEEAQAALARKHMQQQELVEKSNKAEKEKLEMEKTLFDSKQKIASLEDDIRDVKKQKETFRSKLLQTEASLKKTRTILAATQKTEAKLLAEATALLNSLQFSIDDGDELYSQIVKAREIDVQKRLATKQFHLSTATTLQEITSSLQQLSEGAEQHFSAIKDTSTKGSEQDQASLSKSLEMTREISHLVSKLTQEMKSRLMDEFGLVPALTKMSDDTVESVNKAIGFVENGEELLNQSFQSINQQLEEYSSWIQNSHNTFTSISEMSLDQLELDISQSREKMNKMVAEAGSALGDIRLSSMKIRESLNELQSEWKDSIISSSTTIEESAKTQQSHLTSAIELFSNGMQHHDDVETSLTEQQTLLDDKGSSHLDAITAQDTMLSKQNIAFMEGQKRQKEMQEEFMQNVIKGMQQLVEIEMEKLAKDRDESFVEFGERNNSLVTLSNQLHSNAGSIFNQVKETNESLCGKIKDIRENDQKMREVAEESENIFLKIKDIAIDQRDSSGTHALKLKEDIEKLDEQDLLAGQTIEKIEKDVGQCETYLIESVQKNAKTGVSKLTTSESELSDFVSGTIINNVNTALEEMEKPRKEVITNTFSNIHDVCNSLSEGRNAIEEMVNQQCATADDLHQSVITKSETFSNVDAKQRQEQIIEQRDNLISNTDSYVKELSSIADASITHSMSTKGNIKDFAINVIQSEEEVPPTADRKQINYDVNLSSTPSEDVIINDLDTSSPEVSSKIHDDDASMLLCQIEMGQLHRDSNGSTSVKSDVSSIQPSPLKERSLNKENIDVAKNLHSSSSLKVSRNVLRSNKCRVLKYKSSCLTPNANSKKRPASTPSRISTMKKKTRGKL